MPAADAGATRCWVAAAEARRRDESLPQRGHFIHSDIHIDGFVSLVTESSKFKELGAALGFQLPQQLLDVVLFFQSGQAVFDIIHDHF